MQIDFFIEPYIGVKPILFGMVQTQVKSILGDYEIANFDSLSQTYEEIRGGCAIRYSIPDWTVVELSFLPEEHLFFNNKNLFQEKDLITFLLKFDSNPIDYLGFLTFFDLGITVTGYHDDEDQKAITVFKKGS